ncbi:hypothetical protein K7H91_17890 [Martelella mediterranea]|uniref:hypothetical protein n=1 Tax=Martelella mediterranea TaxID=293089 RepID=UPI001E3D3DA5|nr:hypothetical protein [Martelella mediterranea]MCD1635641.1 hypothetical protein [Martelella mediterranea]
MAKGWPMHLSREADSKMLTEPLADFLRRAGLALAQGGWATWLNIANSARPDGVHEL